MTNQTLSAAIKEKSRELGYAQCGIIRAQSVEAYHAALDERIRLFPESRELYDDLRDLAEPLETADWAQSIVVCTRGYGQYHVPHGADRFVAKLYLFDRRMRFTAEYAADAAFEAFFKEQGMTARKGGVAARWAAVEAGLGRFGRNNFLHTDDGSYVTIDTWLVDRALDYDAPLEGKCPCPPNCRKCIDACPTHALSAPYQMNRGKCVAQLSYYPEEVYEGGLVPEDMREQMGMWIYGCDACLDACPRNKNKRSDDVPFPRLEETCAFIAPEAIVRMDEETFLREVQPRFSYIGKDGLWLWKCNALRAMANSGEERYVEAIRGALGDPHEKVREMARWAGEKMGIQ